MESNELTQMKTPSDSLEQQPQKITTARLMKFLIPSLLGALLFLTPVVIDGRMTILVAYAIDVMNAGLKDYMLPIALFLAVVPSIMTVIVSATPKLRSIDNEFVQLFNPGIGWTLMRLLGGIMMALVYFQVGPEWIWNRYTGGVMLLDVAPVLLSIYLISALLLPLLSNFGLMEFIGTLFNRVFSLVFRLPGRAAIDSLASWLAASGVGVILTAQQYRKGFYSKREAAVIATNFSIASIAFSYVVLKFIKMEHMFIPWYASIVVTGIICAIIVPRLYPLRGIDNSYVRKAETGGNDERLPGESTTQWALRRAVDRAEKADPVGKQVKHSLHTTLDLAITVYPSIMLIGVFGLAMIEYTTVLQTLSQPLVPLLELLRLPEASTAAVAIMSGAVDMLMPAILGANIESELTRFVVAGCAVNGILYATDIAVILLRSNLGLNALHLLVIWALRILITLPVLSLIGHMIYS